MQNPNEMRLQKMMKGLEELDLSQEELNLAEEYLEEGKEELLEQLTFRDLSGVSQETIVFFQKLFQELAEREESRNCSGSSGWYSGWASPAATAWCPMDLFRSEGYDFRELDPAQVCSVYAEQICETQYYLGRYALERLMLSVRVSRLFSAGPLAIIRQNLTMAFWCCTPGIFMRSTAERREQTDREAGISRKRNRRRRAAW